MTAIALPAPTASSVVSLRSYGQWTTHVAPTPAPVVVAPTPAPVVVAPTPAPVVVAPAPAPVVVTPAPAPVVVTPAPATAGLTANEQKMVTMINQERIAAGVNPLTVDLRLVAVGRDKANDMKVNNYFSHISPTLGTPWAMMKTAGFPVGWAGENIGKTQSVESAMAGFMRSPGHKANILDPRFTHVGIGIAGNLFVQEFLQIK